MTIHVQDYRAVIEGRHQGVSTAKDIRVGKTACCVREEAKLEPECQQDDVADKLAPKIVPR